jgi:hypothetical protein
MTPEHVSAEDQRLLIGRAKLKAYRFTKGKSGNPGGLSKFYFEARRLARQASPDMMEVLVDIANNPNEDGRVRAVCAVAVLDRAGVRPVDYDSSEERAERPKFDPSLYSFQELEIILQAAQLMAERRTAPASEAADG